MQLIIYMSLPPIAKSPGAAAARAQTVQLDCFQRRSREVLPLICSNTLQLLCFCRR